MYTYLLRCMDGSLYCGYTTDIDRRMNEHKNGSARYTRAKGFKKLEMYIVTDSKSNAMKLECRIKKLNKARKEKLASGDTTVLDSLGIYYKDYRYDF